MLKKAIIDKGADWRPARQRLAEANAAAEVAKLGTKLSGEQLANIKAQPLRFSIEGWAKMYRVRHEVAEKAVTEAVDEQARQQTSGNPDAA